MKGQSVKAGGHRLVKRISLVLAVHDERHLFQRLWSLIPGTNHPDGAISTTPVRDAQVARSSIKADVNGCPANLLNRPTHLIDQRTT